MTHPKQVRAFELWTKAMIRNAQVGTPDYGKNASKTSRTGSSSKMAAKQRKRRKKARRRKKKMQNA